MSKLFPHYFWWFEINFYIILIGYTRCCEANLHRKKFVLNSVKHLYIPIIIRTFASS